MKSNLIQKALRITEGKSDYETYHETFHGVVDAVQKYIDKKKIESTDFSNFMFTGGVNYGRTEKWNFTIDSIKGKNTRKGLHMSVYRMETGRYELTVYVL